MNDLSLFDDISCCNVELYKADIISYILRCLSLTNIKDFFIFAKNM